MLYSCHPAAAHAMRVQAKRARGKTAPRRHFTVDIHCHVFTPEADRLAQPGFRPDYEPMMRHATDATREVNRKQNETIRDKITSVETRLAEGSLSAGEIEAMEEFGERLGERYERGAERTAGTTLMMLAVLFAMARII